MTNAHGGDEIKRELSVEFSHCSRTNEFNSIYSYVEQQLHHLPDRLKDKARRQILLALSKEVAQIDEEQSRDFSTASSCA